MANQWSHGVAAVVLCKTAARSLRLQGAETAITGAEISLSG